MARADWPPSKGYRQWVRIAQELVHKPQVLILDEPVISLDPAHVVEIRNVIRDVGKERPVLNFAPLHVIRIALIYNT